MSRYWCLFDWTDDRNMPSDYSPQVRCAGSAQFFIAVSFKMHWNSVNEPRLPERSALSCFSFTAQFQVPAYSLTFSAYEFPRNVPPFTGTFPHSVALLLRITPWGMHMTKHVRTIVGSHQTSEGNAVDLALSHGAASGDRDDLQDETQGLRAS